MKKHLALAAFILTRCSAWAPPSSRCVSNPSRTSSSLNLYVGDDIGSCGPGGSSGGGFFLSNDDMSRLQQVRARHKTLPVMILDTVLPGQKIEFGSHDARFRSLINYLEESGADLAMLGFNPHTGEPLSLGVTVSIDTQREEGPAVILSATGNERLEVQGQPWLDPTGSFYLCDVELVSARPEPGLNRSEMKQAHKLSEKLPDMLDKWISLVIQQEIVSPQKLQSQLEEMGPLPESILDRSIWIACLLNPMPSLNLSLEIRPAMLSCKNDFDRIHLAHTALEASIAKLSERRQRF